MQRLPAIGGVSAHSAKRSAGAQGIEENQLISKLQPCSPELTKVFKLPGGFFEAELIAAQHVNSISTENTTPRGNQSGNPPWRMVLTGNPTGDTCFTGVDI